MRYNQRAAAVAGILASASGSIVVEAFVATPASFHTVVHCNHDSNKLRFGHHHPRFPFPNTALLGRARRRQQLLVSRTAGISEIFSLRSAPPINARGTSGVSAAVHSRQASVRRPLGITLLCSISSDDGSNGSGGMLNPLDREDPERARLNTLITVLAETPMENWKPAVLDEFMSSLLKGGLYRQAMSDRLAKVRSGDEQQALTRVDAFLTGYLSQEKRRASRKKVSIILGAAMEGPMELDDCVRILGKEELLDEDLTEYIASLVTTEHNKGTQSTLLKVLKTVRDRVQAELKTGERPEVRALAQALTIDDSAERKEFIQHAFTKLEDLDEFVKFVQEGVEYMGNEFRFAVQSNMPPENYDKMKAVYAEAAAIRRSYLQ